jgi:putative DNA primase/helicase
MTQAPPISITWLATSPVEAKRLHIGKMWAPAPNIWPVTSGVMRDAYFFEPAVYNSLDEIFEDLVRRIPGGLWTIAAGAPKPGLDFKTAMHARDGSNFLDIANRLLVLDFDGLIPDPGEDLNLRGVNPFDSDRIVQVLCAHLGKAGLNALTSAGVILLATASTGFPYNAKGQPAQGCARFRALFETDAPITLAQQKMIAAAIGRLPGFESTEQGKSCIDGNLYSLAHNVFVSRPVLPSVMGDPIPEPARIYEGMPTPVDILRLRQELGFGPEFDNPPKPSPRQDNDGRSRALPVAPELRHTLIRQALKAIPNKRFDRDRWVHMAHAIEGALDGDPAAEMLFLRFSKRRLDGPSDPAEDWRMWESRGEGRAGYGFIMQQLEAQKTPEASAAIEAIRAAQTDFKPLPERKGSLLLINAAAIRPEPVDWLWKDWLQARAFNLLAGQSTAGKSTIALDFSAEITAGGVWPDGSPAAQGHVVFWSGEDAIENTLLPRFLAASGDPRFMHFIGGVEHGGKKWAFDPARDMPELMRAVQNLDSIRMIVLDPVAVVVTGDSHKNTEARVGLQPFADLCMHTRACGLGVHHFTKNTSGGHPLDRVSGSLAFHALPRCVLVAARDQNGGEDAPRALIRAKISNGPDHDGFEYGLERAALTGYPEITAQRAAWGNPVFGTAREILASFEPQKAKAVKGPQAIEFLEAALKDGPRAAEEVIRESLRAGISEWALRQAKRALGIVIDKKGFQGASMWMLPEVAF